MKKDERYLWKKSRETNRIYRNVSYRVRRFRYGDEAKYEPKLRHASLRTGYFELTLFYMSNVVFEFDWITFETTYFDIEVGRSFALDSGYYTLTETELNIQHSIPLTEAIFIIEPSDLYIARTVPLDYTSYAVTLSEDTEIYVAGPGLWARLRATLRGAQLRWNDATIRKINKATLDYGSFTVTLQDAADFYKQGEVDTGYFNTSFSELTVVRSIIRQLSPTTITTTFSEIPFSSPYTGSYIITWGELRITNPTRTVAAGTFTVEAADMNVRYVSRSVDLDYAAFDTTVGESLDITSSFKSVSLGGTTYAASFTDILTFTNKVTITFDPGEYTVSYPDTVIHYSVYKTELDAGEITTSGYDIDASISILINYSAQLDYGYFNWEETDWAVAYIDRRIPLTDYAAFMIDGGELTIQRRLPPLGYMTCTVTGQPLETARFRHGVFNYTGGDVDAVREMPVSYILATGFNSDPYIQLYKVS